MQSENMPLVIVAGTYEQARNYAREQHLSQRQWIFLGDEARIYGLRDGKYVKVGTWFENKKINSILHQLSFRNFKEIEQPKQEGEDA